MNETRNGGESPPDAGPDELSDVPARSWMAIAKRTFREFQDDNLTDWAAALTYYSVLALFPALLVLVALLGVVGQYPQTVNALLDIVGDLGPESAVDTFRGPIEGVVQSRGGAGALLGIGLLGALWSASGYVGAFTRAANAIWETEEGRPFYKLRPLQILITLVGVMLLAIVLIGLVVTGPVAGAVGDAVGLGSTAVTVWNIAKWPVLLLIVMSLIAGLYYVTPNVRHPRFRFVSVGGVVAVVTWLIASALFALYVANFSSYNETYGSLGAVIVFLLWLWITNLAILFGVQLGAELERERELRAGEPAREELQLPPRQAPKKTSPEPAHD
jgi:membrane protein